MECIYLDKNHYLFGNKGDVFNKTTHIAKTSQSVTMCGRPMLSTNWSRIEEVSEPGCYWCKELYYAESLQNSNQETIV